MVMQILVENSANAAIV